MTNTHDTTTNEALQARLHRLEAAEQQRIAANRRLGRLGATGMVLGALVLPAVATAVDLPHAFQAGDPVVAAELNENFDALSSAIDALVIREDTTIQIDPAQTCAAIQQALDELDGRSIAGPVTVTIELVPGTYACSDTIVVRHRDGSRIHIRGAGNAPGDVTLTFPPSTDGVRLADAGALGSLENLTLQGADLTGVGINVQNGAVARVSDLVATEFEWGVFASRGATIVGAQVLATANSNGIGAYRGGTVELEDSSAADNGNSGFFALAGGRMHLYGCTSETNGAYGFVSYIGGLVETDGMALSNGASGFRVDQDSTLFTVGAVATGNGWYGYDALLGAYIARTSPQPSAGNAWGEQNMPTGSLNLASGSIITQ
jgi:hypothetical protein